MKKLDEAIDRVAGIHVVRAGQPAPLAVWMAFHSAVLALLAAIAEWRKGPRLCVAILATDPADRVLLVRTARGWELPGGKVQDEPWQDAARREAREETGLEVTLTGAPQVLNGEPAPGAAYRSVVLVARARAEGTPTAGDDALEAAWFARAELPWGALSELVSVEALRAWATERRADGVVYAPWFPGPRPTTEQARTSEGAELCPECLKRDHSRKLDPVAGRDERGNPIRDWHAEKRRSGGDSLPADYDARRAQGETGHGVVLPAEMAVIANEPIEGPHGPLYPGEAEGLAAELAEAQTDLARALAREAEEDARAAESCAGCQKVARHPGEGYRCAAHPVHAPPVLDEFDMLRLAADKGRQ